MSHEIAAVLGPRATCSLATSALPGAPVLPVRERHRSLFVSRLLSMRPGRGR